MGILAGQGGYAFSFGATGAHKIYTASESMAHTPRVDNLRLYTSTVDGMHLALGGTGVLLRVKVGW